MHSPTEPHVIQLGSILLNFLFLFYFFFFLNQRVIFSWTASTSSFHAYFPHTSSITIHAVTDHNDGGMAHWTKHKPKTPPPIGGALSQLTEIHLHQRTRIFYPLTRQEVMTTVCKFGKFNSIQFFFFFCLIHHARNTSYLLSVFMCQRLRDIY